MTRLLRQARLDAGLTQQQVVDRLGRKHQSFVAKYEAGDRRLDVIEFIEVARVIETDPLVLMKKLIAASDIEAGTDDDGRKVAVRTGSKVETPRRRRR
ncbi:MAG: helix-turn-helix transcriptional regulator [Bauldia litoralis]|uniref:helix-turn-helix domain-containing protein n=1 Tax=Bauldia litoralis TaxID=665467 RepID=UPI003298BA3B